MTATSERLPDSKRVIVPLRLIFWGIIVCILGIQINHFDIINDFAGMVMITWGVIALSRVPISVSYQRWMAFSIVVAVISTIVTFFTEVLYPLKLIQTPTPTMTFWTLAMLWSLTMVAGTVVFLRCMREYCSVMNWERVIASWWYSIRLTSYGVGISVSILTITLLVCFPFLDFYPNNPARINWTAEWHDCGGIQHVASRNGEIIYTSEIIPRGESFSYPKLAPSRHDGAHITFGDWFAPLGGVVGWVVTPLLLLVAFFLIWTTIHILMSISRMICVAEKPSPAELAANIATLHLRLLKREQRRRSLTSITDYNSGSRTIPNDIPSGHDVASDK